MSRHAEVIFAVYQGDELVVVGTANEVGKFIGVKPKTVYSMATPKRREAAEKAGNKFAIRVEP